MIRIAVAEDEASWAQQLQSYLDRYARESGQSFDVVLFPDGEDLVERYQGQFDLIFLDPPYASGLLEQALEDIARFDICRRHGIIVAESAADKTLPPLSSPYSIYREYRYGKIKLTVYHRNED